ncbi:hypothetical protein E0H32_04010 [Rhizobium leguminosarum bv. viciae]|nr:hypothetical protein E0H32_04010 [Rhizobium leguminosarum bv. viciae]
MSAKNVQRFWDDDVHQDKDLKRVARTEFYATRFRARSNCWKGSRLWHGDQQPPFGMPDLSTVSTC